MAPSEIQYLMTAVIQEQDIDLAMRALNSLKAPIFHLSSTGGFLGRRNATVMIGLPRDKEREAVDLLQKSCRQRIEYLAIPLEGSPLPMPTPVPVTVGGATIFTLPVEHFEEF